MADRWTNAYRDLRKMPGACKPGVVINRLKIIKPLVEHSALYGRPWFTGEILCECLGPPDGSGCGKQIKVSRQWLYPGRPKASKYSCGECCKRPRKREKYSRRPQTHTGGRPVIDLLGMTFDQLEVYARDRGAGWRCKCACGLECIVPRSYQLLRGTIGACERCRPWEWTGKRGRKPKEKGQAG